MCNQMLVLFSMAIVSVTDCLEVRVTKFTHTQIFWYFIINAYI